MPVLGLTWRAKWCDAKAVNPHQLITALLTFAGTVLVTAAGFWQWRRSQTREERGEYRDSRINSLREVWEALSDAEAHHRLSIQQSDKQAARGLSLRIVEVNLLILRNSPFMLLDEQVMAQQYTHYLLELNTLFRAEPQGSKDAERWALTEQLSDSETMTAIAATELESLRRRFAVRYAEVVRGEVQ